jgi:hypothetical protein
MTSTATAQSNLSPRIISLSDTGLVSPPPRRRVIDSPARTDNKPIQRELVVEGQEGASTTTELRPDSNSAYEEAERILACYYSDCDPDEAGQRLATQIRAFIRKFGSQAVKALSSTIIQEGEKFQDAICDTLQILGCHEHMGSYLERRWLLEKLLKSRFSRIRYGAALGLAYMQAAQSIPYLRAAIENETIPELKATFSNVLSSLE